MYFQEEIANIFKSVKQENTAAERKLFETEVDKLQWQHREPFTKIKLPFKSKELDAMHNTKYQEVLETFANDLGKFKKSALYNYYLSQLKVYNVVTTIG